MKVILEIDHTVSKEEIVDWLEGILKPSTPCVWGYSFEEHHCGSCQNSQLEKLKAEIIEIEKVSDKRFDENKELKALIGKMKNVGNCKHAMDCSEFNEKEFIYGKLRICQNCKEWELAE